VSNSRITLGWSGKAGGTLTTFRSAATGLDYAAGSCGGGIGSWGRYDVHQPAISTVDFVGQERKLWQRDLPEGTVKVKEVGPVFATVEVEAKRGNTKFSQHYVVFTGQAGFAVRSDVESDKPAPEAVALDFRIRRNDLWKLFPNFVGTPEGFAATAQAPAGKRRVTFRPTPRS